ncbi:MAG: insecticidal toxin protein, partial [Myxococcota bacterium]
RFRPFVHPYVGDLTARLMRGGTAGLQAADTAYTPDGATLPDNVELEVGANTSLTVAEDSLLRVIGEGLEVSVGGSTLALSEGIPVRLASDRSLSFSGGAWVRQWAAMVGPPPRGTTVTLAQAEAATLMADARVALAVATPVVLLDGTAATVSRAGEAAVARGSRVTVPAATEAVLRDHDPQPVLFDRFMSSSLYGPTDLVALPWPVKDLDFSTGGAYAVYNWELFFHVPFTLAVHLSKNQRFADAQRWFHLVFDPTDDSDGPTPERFWKVKPFQSTEVVQVEKMLVNLATGADEELRRQTVRSIEAWHRAPFVPHARARYHFEAFMKKTVMAYCDNLLAWGDSLFRQDTGEAIDEALGLYILTANILGPRPETVPKKGTVRPQTYANLRRDLSRLGTVLRDVEASIPFDLVPGPVPDANEGDAAMASVRSLGKALYFGVPRNDKLLGYWDTVADRLFKIRNSLNFQGVFRRVALFAPPIDPALLARAAASGLDIAGIISGLHQPLPLVRFNVLARAATELAQEVKSLGGQLLSVMEKEDGEALALLRAKHERAVLKLAEHVRYGQLEEAKKSREALHASLVMAVERYSYYERQLGRDAGEILQSIPELEELEDGVLEEMKLAVSEPVVAPRPVDVDIATSAFADATRASYGGRFMSSYEVREARHLEEAQSLMGVANTLSMASSVTALIPQFDVNASPLGVGAGTGFGGRQITAGITAASTAKRGDADGENFEARRAQRIDSFARREREWAFQSNLAAGEIAQIFKQIRAAQIREAVAAAELESHRRQMENAEEIERFMNETGNEKGGKRTHKALYTWMKREVKGLYAQCYDLAYDVARRAERALQHELGDTSLTYLQPSYLGGREGLLAGEKLFLDLKRMELSYMELNQRQYELTKSVSVLQLDPMALLMLRRTGRCTVTLPETLFDFDGPGHYFRRIRTVAVSVPCVTGPHVSVNCTLTLLKSSIRTSPQLRDNTYGRLDTEDDRFDDYFGRSSAIVTSTGQRDPGQFEETLGDERYLPFENAGAISEWQLELPGDPSAGDPLQFDYDTITDVVLHVRYTAREGGQQLKQAAKETLKAAIANATANGSVRLFSVR